jgi:hypothetical protein
MTAILWMPRGFKRTALALGQSSINEGLSKKINLMMGGANKPYPESGI